MMALTVLIAFLSLVLLLMCVSLVYEYHRRHHLIYLVEAICIFLAYISGGILVDLIIRQI